MECRLFFSLFKISNKWYLINTKGYFSKVCIFDKKIKLWQRYKEFNLKMMQMENQL